MEDNERYSKPLFFASRKRVLFPWLKRNYKNAITADYYEFERIKKFAVSLLEKIPIKERRKLSFSYIEKFNSGDKKAANIWLRTEIKNREAAARSAEEDSLVKGSESQTPDFQHNLLLKQRNAEIDGQINLLNARKRKQHFEKLHTCPEPDNTQTGNNVTPLFDYLAQVNHVGSISNETKTCVRMFKQEWSGKFKFNLVTGALGSKTAPPETSGERISTSLTQNATRNILESGAYLSACRNGYTTFLTLTFDTEARKQLETIVAIDQNKKKTYKNEFKYRARNPETNRMKTYIDVQQFTIRCIEGVPYELVEDLAKMGIEFDNGAGCSNAVKASAIHSKVTFEPLTTIGKEVSKFFDNAQKIYQRGFVPEFIETKAPDINGYNQKIVCISQNNDKTPVGMAATMYCPELIEHDDSFEKYSHRKHHDSELLDKIRGEQEISPPLDYMWVAEQPENDQGEKNPHVHVMMRWQVNSQIFQAWAKRLEKVWGNGFAKLERIHTAEAASNYLLKAVGYLTKGSVNDQGEILGNRYGISASARAPKWECIGEFYADNFLAILGELREKLERKKAKLRAKASADIELKERNGKSEFISSSDLKARVSRLKNVNKKSPSENREKYIDYLKSELLDNEQKVEAISNYRNQLPYMNEFAIGGMDEEQAANFLHWAMSERFWNAEVKENRFSTWSELKANTIEAVKQARRYNKHMEWIHETSELTWQWARNDANFERISTAQYIMLDEHGNEYELVA